jgi:hypothetical protein
MSINETGDYNNDLFSDGEIYHPGGIHDDVSHVDVFTAKSDRFL